MLALSGCCPWSSPACGVPELTGGVLHAHVAICIFLQSRLSPLQTALAIRMKPALSFCKKQEMCLQDTDFVDSCSVDKSTWTGWFQSPWSTWAVLGNKHSTWLHISSHPFLTLAFIRQCLPLLNFFPWRIYFVSEAFLPDPIYPSL